MRQRPGKMRNPDDLRRRFSVLHEIVIPLSAEEPDGICGKYIREHCRRADWAQYTQWRIGGPMRDIVTTYLFADVQDAILFKMKFQ